MIIIHGVNGEPSRRPISTSATAPAHTASPSGLALIVNSNQVIGCNDTMNSDDPIRIAFKEVFEERDGGFAPVGKRGLMLNIVRGHPAFKGLSDFLLLEE